MPSNITIARNTLNSSNQNADTDQSVKRNAKGQFAKGTKPTNGFDKNPQNIAPGGYWRYKADGRAAIADIFKMTLAEFETIEHMIETDITVLDDVLYKKFLSARSGNARDAEYLINQAFGTSRQSINIAPEAAHNPFAELTEEELRALARCEEHY